MATFKQAIERAMKSDLMKMVSVNQNMIQISAQGKKSSAFVKTAVPEELARGLMQRKKVAFILHIDGDELNAIVAEIDAETESDST